MISTDNQVLESDRSLRVVLGACLLAFDGYRRGHGLVIGLGGLQGLPCPWMFSVSLLGIERQHYHLLLD